MVVPPIVVCTRDNILASPRASFDDGGDPLNCSALVGLV
jgi:hypothetical protein